MIFHNFNYAESLLKIAFRQKNIVKYVAMISTNNYQIQCILREFEF
jgi:hypothetical protein